MKTCIVVGRKNHGKTKLIVELVEELRRRNVRVGTIKHSGHDHPLDTPGKDSFRHKQAGAEPAAIITANTAAVFFTRPSCESSYEHLRPLFEDCDLILVEGNPDLAGMKLEVFRAGLGTQPMAEERDDIAAVISDDPVEVGVPVWPRAKLVELADRIQFSCSARPIVSNRAYRATGSLSA